MTNKKAYKIVLKDMLNSGCDLLVGKYDARNGSKTYMHGVAMVMEWIAYRVSEEVGKSFSNMFIDNMIESGKEKDE